MDSTCRLGGIRRIGNKPLPQLKLRDKKQKEKEGEEEGKTENTGISERDFKNPKIIEFTTATVSEEDPSWRDLEKDLQVEYPTLKLLYSRMEDRKGQLALSSQKTDEEAVKKLIESTFTSKGFEYKFDIPSEDNLKEFWKDHGSHYEMVSRQKIKKLKKRKPDQRNEDRAAKRQKHEEDDEKQYTIAGVTYANINKVKSKAKAIMNVKEKGQKLEGFEEEFMKEIIKHHEKHDEKWRDFSHFIVDDHPDHPSTSWFFVVRNDGTKEDFSMSKCIENMRNKA